jgi:hypothetical protein
VSETDHIARDRGVCVRLGVDLTTQTNASKRRRPPRREEQPDYEKDGGACSKMAAPRNNAAIQRVLSSGTAANFWVASATPVTVGAVEWWQFPDRMNVTAQL